MCGDEPHNGSGGADLSRQRAHDVELILIREHVAQEEHSDIDVSALEQLLDRTYPARRRIIAGRVGRIFRISRAELALFGDDVRYPELIDGLGRSLPCRCEVRILIP